VVVLWLVLTITMRKPRYLSSMVVKMDSQHSAEPEQLSARLSAVPGVAEVVVIPEEKVAYLKVDGTELDRDALNVLIAPPTGTGSVRTG
jgi:hypothetical protein